MFDINGAEFVVLAVIVLIVIGPERLPQYAAQLGRMVRELRKFAVGAREQVRAELGPEFDDVDWAKLDPRQYDPRRIVREALSEALDDEPDKPKSEGGPTSLTKSDAPVFDLADHRPDDRTAGTPASAGRGAHRGPTPFDPEAT